MCELTRRSILFVAAAVMAATSAMPARAAMPSHEALRAIGLRQAWQVNLPMKLVTKIENYYLVGGHVLAYGSDGMVHAIRADTGEYVWTRLLGEAGFSTLWEPIFLVIDGSPTFVITRPDDLLFIDPVKGLPLEDLGALPLREPTVAAVAIGKKLIFAPEVNKRFRAYPIGDRVPKWQMMTPGLIRLRPVYIPEREMLIIADESGQLAGIDAETRHDEFKVELEGPARGWLTVDANTVYAAGANGRVYAVSLTSGDFLWRYVLPNRPEKGPTLTQTGVYQSVFKGGVQRINKSLEEARWPNWLVPDARAFLAEWPGHVGLLMMDGRLAVAAIETGEIRTTVQLDGDVVPLRNPYNDAMIVATPAGDVRCYRPLNSSPLTPVDFGVRPVETTQPAATATTEKSEDSEEEGVENGDEEREDRREVEEVSEREEAPEPEGDEGVLFQPFGR